MYQMLARKIFGTRHDRELKRIGPVIAQINDLENRIQGLDDAALKARIQAIRLEIEKGLSLDNALPEVFAIVREAGRRTLGMRHFDVQLIGGITLHEGRIAEMKTGEGKTLAATLPVSLNALAGKGVHVVTVNDYLARRDAEWMSRIYNFLGLTVGTILHDLDDRERKVSYNSDITYGTNNEFGFDYLRDNMKLDPDHLVQRDLHFAIVDEVDSILIDEARTPLIISGPAEESTEKYVRIDKVIPALKKERDYVVDEKARTVVLTEEHGIPHVEKALGVDNLFDILHADTLHHVNQALRAHVLFKRDIDYVVQNNQVVIVDEFTGRLMPGRRWGDGLHQAVEAKEGVKIENENQTLASITFQNYFRMYRKLGGMTGTADTEAPEFAKIYKLDVMVIPTNRDMVRQDLADQIYKTEKEKFHAVIEEIKARHQKGQPVLVGTISIEKSELLSLMLKRTGVKHNVLNAKHHEREAEIVAQAGRKGAVTISTNMAGRGTDIMLGGNPEFMAKSKVDPIAEYDRYRELLEEYRKQCQTEHDEVVAVGGLHIIGTERHESRRIDNQLRGRAGRQGDPGSSRFYLSLDDDLLRIFGSERIRGFMDRLGMEENEPIEHPWLSKAIENAQARVEDHNFNARKNVLEYDDVMNQQRQAFYGWRRNVLIGESIKDLSLELIEEEIMLLADEIGQKRVRPAEWDWTTCMGTLHEIFGVRWEPSNAERAEYTPERLSDELRKLVFAAYEERETKLTAPVLRHMERIVSLQIMDHLWKDHLLQMDHLREGIGLRGYAQKDPLLEYKKEGSAMFMDMEARIRNDVVKTLFRAQVATESELEEMQERQRRNRERMAQMMEQSKAQAASLSTAPGAALGATPPPQPKQAKNLADKVGRNDPCPCGSGKKYKKCHGA